MYRKKLLEPIKGRLATKPGFSHIVTGRRVWGLKLTTRTVWKEPCPSTGGSDPLQTHVMHLVNIEFRVHYNLAHSSNHLLLQ